MLFWEQIISKMLHAVRLDSIRSKILIFALMATLIPSLSIGWLSYVYANKFLTDKIEEELRNTVWQTVRVLDLWLKERRYELRVFSSSYEVSENLEKSLRAGGQGTPPTSRRLKDFLKSVRGKFVDYEELAVMDLKGRVVATSADRGGPVNLPSDWQKRAKTDAAIYGDAYWDEALDKAVMTMAVPIKATDSRLIGALAAKVNFRSIDEILKSSRVGITGHVYLIKSDRHMIVSSQIPLSSTKIALPAETAQALFEKETTPIEYVDHQQREVIGTLKRVFQMEWGVVAEVNKEDAYAQVALIQYLILLIVSGLLLVMSLLAYILGLTIVRPLSRLTQGASRVAAGDLTVDLPAVGRGEVDYLTNIFNFMVSSLREKTKELHEISVTDSLTGLHNRKDLLETLAEEITRAKRHKHPFSVLMIDIDHFKRYNDTYGHLAGDNLLVKVAEIFADTIRSEDYAARYGGEEFLIMLPETGMEGAAQIAERIRIRIAADTVENEPARKAVTVSIGVAAFPDYGNTPEKIIARADEALYEAKRSGRNRTVLAK